jgi:hypothetical protein
MFRTNVSGRKIRELGTSISRWLETEPQLETTSYIITGREGVYATWEINREERGRVCVEGQQAGSRGLSITGRVSVWGGGKILTDVSCGFPQFLPICTATHAALRIINL